MPGWASANRPSRYTSHLAAKSGDVLTVRTPEFCRLQYALGAGGDSVECVTYDVEIFAAGVH